MCRPIIALPIHKLADVLDLALFRRLAHQQDIPLVSQEVPILARTPQNTSLSSPRNPGIRPLFVTYVRRPPTTPT
jgi:hypothetical protein